jgi:hypothetical protein
VACQCRDKSASAARHEDRHHGSIAVEQNLLCRFATLFQSLSSWRWTVLVTRETRFTYTCSCDRLNTATSTAALQADA